MCKLLTILSCFRAIVWLSIFSIFLESGNTSQITNRKYKEYIFRTIVNKESRQTEYYMWPSQYKSNRFQWSKWQFTVSLIACIFTTVFSVNDGYRCVCVHFMCCDFLKKVIFIFALCVLVSFGFCLSFFSSVHLIFFSYIFCNLFYIDIDFGFLFRPFPVAIQIVQIEFPNSLIHVF